MTRITNAIVLVAGKGSRLWPVTNEAPKCMTEIDGIPVLERTLTQLHRVGVTHATIVVGYMGESVVQHFGNRYGDVNLSYRWNEVYGETNSMYSAWLARDILEQGAILIEGDVVFDSGFAEHLAVTMNDEQAYWMVAPFGPESEGSMSITNADGRITQIRIVRERLPEYLDNYYKSTGVLKVTPRYGQAMSAWLSQEVLRGNTNVYYDLVVSEHLDDVPIHAKDVHPARWYEVDDLGDLRKAERCFQKPKHVIIVIDGAADLKIPELGNKTPLQAAHIPTIDRLTKEGTTGLMKTSYSDLPIGSIVANMGILGYPPTRYYPFGRASFEAMAQNLFLDDGDLVFRCNLISVDDDERISDFTANFIDDSEALAILNSLEGAGDDIELYAGQSYRNLLIVRNAGCLPNEITASEPHTNIGTRFPNILLKALTPAAEPIVDTLNGLMLSSLEQIRTFNQENRTAADMIWLWSPSGKPHMPSFEQRYGLRGAVVAGLDFMRGIGMAVGMMTCEIKGATGYLDTNLAQKLRYVKNFLQYNDLVFLHINAPDEESHAGHVEGKIRAIERAENEIVEPLMKFLQEHYPDNFRIAILPDHYTQLSDGQHTDAPVPYCIYGKDIEPDTARNYCEEEIESCCRGKINSYDFMRSLACSSLEPTLRSVARAA